MNRMCAVYVVAVMLAGCQEDRVTDPDPRIAKCYQQFDEMAAAFNEMKKANEALLSVVRDYERMVKERSLGAKSLGTMPTLRPEQATTERTFESLELDGTPAVSSPPISELGWGGTAPAVGPYDLGSAKMLRDDHSERFTLGDSFSFHGAKIDRFYYGTGESWCNVWADDKGMHWEACK